MGTHPIFESDFDCLTDFDFKKMNHDELIIKDRERNQDIVVKILKMPRGIFIWIGLDSSDFGCLSVGVPNRRDKKSSVSSVVLQNSQNATQMAARLSKLLQVQVFIGGNLGDESETAWRLVETRIKEEQMTNTALFSF